MLITFQKKVSKLFVSFKNGSTFAPLFAADAALNNSSLTCLQQRVVQENKGQCNNCPRRFQVVYNDVHRQ